jgi:hypothetical protein
MWNASRFFSSSLPLESSNFRICLAKTEQLEKLPDIDSLCEQCDRNGRKFVMLGANCPKLILKEVHILIHFSQIRIQSEKFTK